MTPIVHNYSNLASKTVLWDTMDSQDWYQKNIQHPDLRKKLEETGYIDAHIEYQYNSHGFRTAEFDRQFDVVCFGCSFTMGTGLYAHDTWPEQLAAITGLEVANLGHAGSSNDTAFRFAEYYLKFLKPRYAIWLQTDMHRIEVLDDSIPLSMNIMATDTRNPCANDYFIKTWFSSSSNQLLNLQKNTLAFEQLCLLLGIKSIVLGREKVPPHPPFPNGGARDLTHPGADIYKPLVQQIKTIIDGPAVI